MESFVTTHLGQVQLDLSGLIVQRAVIATGFGDIRVVSPEEALEPLHLRSTLGNVHLIVPPGSNVRITASGSSLFHVHADETRYEAQPQGGSRYGAQAVYVTRDPHAESPLIEISVSGTFGDAYLA